MLRVQKWQFLCYFFRKIALKAMRTERVKSIIYAGCGMISARSMNMEQLRNVRSRTVRAGIEGVRFDGVMLEE
jgi:hypothetical protein